MNCSSFVLFVSDAQHDIIEENVSQHIEMVDIVRDYPIQNDKYKYWVMQLDIMDYLRTPQEMCQWIIANFSFICMKQTKSTHIFVPDQKAYQEAMSRMYGSNRKQYFLYDMLSIEDRYIASTGSEEEIDYMGAVKLKLQENGNIYSISFSKECVFLFSPNNLIDLIDTNNGTMLSIDIIDGLQFFKFYIVILK